MRSLLFLVPLLALFLNADLELRRHALQLGASQDRSTPKAHLLFSNGYRALGVDFIWIATLVEDGQDKAAGRPSTNHTLDAGILMAGIDPHFYALYEWVPAAYLVRNSQVSEKTLLRISDLLDVGIANFPDDPHLPFSAGMNFIGHSDTTDFPRRRREITRAIEYLTVSWSRPDANPDIPSIISALRRRLSELSDDPKSEVFDADFIVILLRINPERASHYLDVLPIDLREEILRRIQLEPVNQLHYIPGRAIRDTINLEYP